MVTAVCLVVKGSNHLVIRLLVAVGGSRACADEVAAPGWLTLEAAGVEASLQFVAVYPPLPQIPPSSTRHRRTTAR